MLSHKSLLSLHANHNRREKKTEEKKQQNLEAKQMVEL